jgi:two-component system response regulator YesN
MSKRQVSRTFEKEFNSSFTKELMAVRLREAQRQLAETDKNLQDICIDIGFSNQSYFAACFKKHLGMTPSEYRAGQREKRRI